MLSSDVWEMAHDACIIKLGSAVTSVISITATISHTMRIIDFKGKYIHDPN